MRILFLTQYYPPETGAAQNRISDLAQRLATEGHTIAVLTAMPNYLRGAVFKEYQSRFLLEEQVGDVRVVRSWIYATSNGGFVPRLANYMSFVGSSLIAGLLKIRGQDIVVVESPPLMLGISGLILCWFLSAKLVFNVSDLWPRSAIELGVLRNQTIIRLSTALEDFIYSHSDLITGQTKGIVSDIQSRVSKPVILCTNGADPSDFTGTWDRTETRRRLGIAVDKFVVGFVGLHGLVYDLEAIISTAEKLAAHDDMQFVFIGDGPEKPRLRELAKAKKLKNVVFLSSQARAAMPEITNALDLSVAPLRKLELFKGTLPAKLFEAMAGGVPLVVAIDGEAREMVEHSHAGICVSPGDFGAFQDAILFLHDHPEICREMGVRGREFVAAHYDRRAIAKRVEDAYLELLTPVASQTAYSPT